MAKLVSNVYGDALFELAVEADKLEGIRASYDTYYTGGFNVCAIEM